MSELMHFSKHYIVTIGKAWLLNINTNKAHIKILIYDCLRLYCEGRNILEFNVQTNTYTCDTNFH